MEIFSSFSYIFPATSLFVVDDALEFCHNFQHCAFIA